MNGTANPKELAVLKQAYDGHCAAAGIPPNDPHGDLIAHTIMALFNNGVTTLSELRLSLERTKMPDNDLNGKSPTMSP